MTEDVLPPPSPHVSTRGEQAFPVPHITCNSSTLFAFRGSMSGKKVVKTEERSPSFSLRRKQQGLFCVHNTNQGPILQEISSQFVGCRPKKKQTSCCRSEKKTGVGKQRLICGHVSCLHSGKKVTLCVECFTQTFGLLQETSRLSNSHEKIQIAEDNCLFSFQCFLCSQ